MKIIRLTTLLDFGGQERKYISFTDKKELLKNEYIFAAIGHGGNAEKTLRDRGFEVKIFNLPISHRNWKNIFIIKNWLKEMKPDIVHTAASEANFHGILAAKLAGVPVIIGEEIGIPNHSNTAKLIFNLVYKLADKVVGVSHAVIDHLVKINEIPYKKGIIIYNPVSTYKSIETNTKTDKNKQFQWLYIGRLAKVKNVSFLIKAFSKLPNDKRGILNIVGNGSEYKLLKKLTANLNIKEEVIFHGYSSHPEEFLTEANAFVLPSLSEGFGIAVVEAMFQSVPVLCSDVGGIPEYVDHGINGWLFQPNEVQLLTNLMQEILNMDTTELQTIGLKGKETVINQFTVEKYIENIENLYQKLYKSK